MIRIGAFPLKPTTASPSQPCGQRQPHLVVKELMREDTRAITHCQRQLNKWEAYEKKHKLPEGLTGAGSFEEAFQGLKEARDRTVIIAQTPKRKTLIGIASLWFRSKGVLTLDKLQVSPAFNHNNANRKYSGIGRGMMYTILKMAAESKNLLDFGALPEARTFYQELTAPLKGNRSFLAITRPSRPDDDCTGYLIKQDGISELIRAIESRPEYFAFLERRKK